MLPPVDKAVLLANPQFEVLYNDLRLNKLEQDGGLRLDDRSSVEQRVFEQDLRRARVKSTQRDLLFQSLTLISQDDGQSPGLQELVTITAAILDGQLDSSDASVVYEPIESFKSELPNVSSSISKELHQTAKVVREMISLQDFRSEDDLASVKDLARRQQAARSSHREIQAATVEQASLIHEKQRVLIELCVRTLEQTVHGSETRAVKAKVDNLATMTEGMTKKVAVQQSQLAGLIDNAEEQAALRRAIRMLRT